MVNKDIIENKRDNSKKEFTKIEFDEFIWPWFTPKWFEFLSWILIIALFQGIFKKTNNFFVGIVYSLSNLCLINYFFGKLSKFFVNVKFIFYSRRSRIIFTAIFSFILMLAINLFINKIINQLMIHVNQ